MSWGRPPPLPAEFLGKARALRRTIIAQSAASKAAIDTILAPLCDQLRRRPTMRTETIAGAMRAWRLTMPAGNRVSLAIETRDGRARINEVCFLASELSKPSWDDWEQAIVLTALDVTIGRRQVEMSERDIAAWNLHCIGRRFQRSATRDSSPDAVLRDMAAIATRDPETMPPGEFNIALYTGWWAGQRCMVEGKPVLSIRTYFDAAAVPDHRLVAAGLTAEACA